MHRCEFADAGTCRPYIAIMGTVLRENKINNLLLSGIDMSVKCKEAGLPCYDQNHKNSSCHKEILNIN